MLKNQFLKNCSQTGVRGDSKGASTGTNRKTFKSTLKKFYAQVLIKFSKVKNGVLFLWCYIKKFYAFVINIFNCIKQNWRRYKAWRRSLYRNRRRNQKFLKFLKKRTIIVTKESAIKSKKAIKRMVISFLNDL